MDSESVRLLATVLPIILITIGLIIYYYIIGDKLFKALETKSPKYYHEIGEPKYFSDILSNWRAQNYLMDLFVTGIPSKFPKDENIRALANRTRKLGVILLVCFAILLALSFSF